MPRPAPPDPVLAAIDEGRIAAVYLVTGDRVLAEPTAVSIGERLAGQLGCEAEIHRRPAALGPLLNDLRTYALFAPAKVVVAIETAVLADLASAAELLAEALEILPLASGGGDLSPRERRAAGRLLQTLSLFQIDPDAGSCEEVIASLPDWSLAGRKPARGRRRALRGAAAQSAREGLAELLAAARDAELRGWAESDLTDLAEAVHKGLPEGHALVLAESAVASDHPVVAALEQRGALVAAGSVEVDRRGRLRGLERLASELERETGVRVRPDALEELAGRTIQLRHTRGRRGGVDADSTARFAAEYRKLATMAEEGEIDHALVASVVSDRGEEDVWKILDAIGDGRADEALRRIARLLAAAEEPLAARLSFFALLATFCRQLTAIAGMVEATATPVGVRSYPRFKERIAPRLCGELADGRPSPLAGIHPYRLHRAYLTAGRLPRRLLSVLPQRVLETELRLKGESAQPDVALAALVTELAAAVGRGG